MATAINSVHHDCSQEIKLSYRQTHVPTWSAFLHVQQGNHAAGQ